MLLPKGLQGQGSSTTRVRRDINSLSAVELDSLRNAFAALQEKSGVKGYQSLAGFHGEPDHYCHRDSAIFLPWHRAYIFRFEEALREVDPSTSLPFWDWTSADAIQNGIPRAFADETYSRGGKVVANPLYSAEIEILSRITTRSPRPSTILRSLASQVAMAYRESTFLDFSSAINGPHGGLHTWVRGDMGSVAYAAFDPIFWFHHANVDRQWTQWQLGPNNQLPSASVQSKQLEPFGLQVKDVLDGKVQLRYEYEGAKPMPTARIFTGEGGNTLELPEFVFDPNSQAVFLWVHGLRPSDTSYNIDVFVNQPDANETTAIEGNPHYAGTFGIFGGGKHQHDEETKPRRIVNLTDAIRALVKEKGKTALKITFVATDLNGKRVEIAKLPLKGFSVQSE